MTGSRVTARRQTWLAERRATAGAVVPVPHYLRLRFRARLLG